MIIEGEECKFIEGTDEFYAVSVTGKVWSFRSGTPNVKRNTPKLRKVNVTSRGYDHTLIRYADGTEKCEKVHRLVAKAFIPNPLNLPEVNHKNENKLDNRVENLEWVDRKTNIHHGSCIENIRKSMIGKNAGSNSSTYIYICPLKLAYLRNIKKLKQYEIAEQFNVSQQTINRRLKALGIK